MSLWWYYAGGEAPYVIGVARAANVRDACAAFGVAWPSPLVNELKSRGAAARFAGLGEGRTCLVETPRLPSYYDRFPT